MKKWIVALFVMAVLVAPLLAQDKPILPTFPLDPETVIGFAVAVFGGVGVKGITEMVKRFLKVEGLGAVLVSAAVSLAVVGWYYIQFHLSFNVGYFIIYSALVFLNANGLYKAGKAA